MIIEISNYVNLDFIKEIKSSVIPYINYNDNVSCNRDGNTVCISKLNELKNLDNKLCGLFKNIQTEIIQHRYKPMYASADNGYEYHIYNPRQICHYHADSEIDSDGSLRYASVVIHLNTVKNGGELIFPSQNRSIKTEIGKVVIFPPYSMYGHYTTPSDEAREVLVSWFVYKDKKVINTM